MTPETIFRIQLIFGYLAWTLCFSAYVLPRLRSVDPVKVHRAIATLHSFRFFGLVFILPGVAGNLPGGFAPFSAYWDLATATLATLALLTIRTRPIFWIFVAAFNIVGITDLFVDYYHAIHLGLPAQAGLFGATYAIPVLYVPMLMITHVYALNLLVRTKAHVSDAFSRNTAVA